MAKHYLFGSSVFEARPPERETMYRNNKESKLENSTEASACNCVKYLCFFFFIIISNKTKSDISCDD